MNYLSDLLKTYARSKGISEISNFIEKKKHPKIHLNYLNGSQSAFFIAALFKSLGKSIFILAKEKQEAASCFDDLKFFFGENQLLFYPHFSYQAHHYSEESILRAEALNKALFSKHPYIFISTLEASFEKIISKEELIKNTFYIKKGESLSVSFLNEWLIEEGFERVNFVSAPKEFSIRGGIVDVFSLSHKTPFRIEFFGQEIESIRTFDPNTQLSLNQEEKISLVSDSNQDSINDKKSLLKEIPSSLLFINNAKETLSSAENIFEKIQEKIESSSNEEYFPKKEAFISPDSLLSIFENCTLIENSSSPYFEPGLALKMKSSPQPVFNKQFPLLIQNLDENTKKGYVNYLSCANQKQVDRFYAIFKDLGTNTSFIPILASFSEGFVDEEQKIALYTDHQIFERFHGTTSSRKKYKNFGLTLKELNALRAGDYITHIDHGIGRFEGLMKIDIEGKTQEAIKLTYQDNDLLYISIHSLYKIAKYIPKEGAEAKLNKLGSNAWKALKNKTKTKLKEVAFNLVELYAKRKSRQGFSFSADSYLQNELEASFLYEDTPDQLSATLEVKSDMESEKCMDRLICGDVGFGKTEVAIRASFKAALDGKQVAILVPTTILAFQHHRTFSQRLKEFPIKVDYLNRFRSSAEKKRILSELQSGRIDIIIGTHQLIGESIKFKDLGLLIVDEEHKFGVSIKDKLKTFRENIDTLTLTATPIPRTLQFSLIGARDLSLIKTPPPNRRPIETELISLENKKIKKALESELSRGGQIFFIHNRVKDLESIADYLRELCPKLKIGLGHGQMQGKELENLMLDFINGKLDLLLSTTIVESGLDVPNANTIFINNAQNFGLADLHQMRGRVGRSNIQAFCYLITPPLSSLSDASSKRLRALEQFSDLGSGFQIAMKDLEIRGAGNLLGAEQSGFISEMGFETYQKILNEVTQELKSNEFDYLNQENKNEFAFEVQLDTDLEILIPDEYVNDSSERLLLYQQLAQIENKEELDEFEHSLRDRFGTLPKEVEDLLESIELKWLAKELGMEKLVLKREKMLCYFVNQASYFKGEVFGGILKFITEHPKQAIFKEKKTTTGNVLSYLQIEKINHSRAAFSWLENIKNKLIS